MENQRLTRTSYALRYVGVNGIFLLLAGVAGDSAALLLILLNVILIMYFAAGRLKDMDANPAWAFATILPLVGFILMFPKGTQGTNKYGENPRVNQKESSLDIQRKGDN